MADEKCLKILKQGVEAWNNWREELVGNLDFPYIDLTAADLSGASFRAANLLGVDFTRALLQKADFTRCNLTGADFTEASLQGANFTGANLTLAQLGGADLRGADFYETVFGNVDLTESPATILLHMTSIESAGQF